MHVDGAEEDLHDELEDVCSDDGELLNTQQRHSVNPACVIRPSAAVSSR